MKVAPAGWNSYLVEENIDFVNYLVVVFFTIKIEKFTYTKH